MKDHKRAGIALLTALALMLGIGIGFPAGPYWQSQALTVGDVNGDAAINALDAARILLYSVDKISLEGDAFTAADVNGDGAVNASDATRVLLYSVGRIRNLGGDPTESEESEPMESGETSGNEVSADDDGSRIPDKDTDLVIGKDDGDEIAIFTDDRIVFSKTAGLYDTAFDLTLSGPQGYTVYYTLDGSDPSVSVTRKTYSKPIPIEESANRKQGALTANIASINGWSALSSQFCGTVVRACAVKGSDQTEVVTNTYFVGKDLAAKYNVPFVAITVKNEDFATKQGIYYTARQDVTAHKEHIPAYAEIFDETGDLQASQFIELSMAGNGSLVYRQRSLRMYFKGFADNPDVPEDNPKRLYYDIFNGMALDANGDPVTSFKRIQLRNVGNDNSTAHLRDPLAQMLAAEMDVDIQANRTTMVFINGEFWGVYSAMERNDDHYFNDHFGVKNENVVVVESPSPLETEDRDKWRDYELSEGEPGDELVWTNLVLWLREHDMSDPENYRIACNQIDMNNLIDTLVANIYLDNTDWPVNNVKVWRNKNPEDPSGMDTKWRFVLMDLDKTLGMETSPSHNNINLLISNSVLTRVSTALLHNPEFKARMIERFDYAAKVVFEPNKCLKVTTDLYEEMMTPMELHCQRWTYLKYSSWKNSSSKIIKFLNDRPAYVLDYVDAFFKAFYKD